jgi:hypothetical protein
MLAHFDSNAFHSCQVGWMSFAWWPILDTHEKLLSVKNQASLQFLTLKLVHLALTQLKGT